VFACLIDLMRLDVVVWNGGLLARRGQSWRYRAVIAAIGGLRLAHLRSVAQEFQDDETRLDDPAWAWKHAGIATGEYLLTAALMPRRTYWRAGMSDVPFFMQTWLGIGLLGATVCPTAALVGGPITAAVTFGAAAVLNGDDPIRDTEVRRRVTNYVRSGGAAGLFIFAITKALSRARFAAEDAAAVGRETARSQAERDALQRLPLEATYFDNAFTESFLAGLATPDLDDSQRERLREELDGYHTPRTEDAPTSATAVDGMVDSACSYAGVATRVRDLVVERPCDLGEADFLRTFLVVAFHNSRLHAGVSEVEVQVCIDARGLTATVCDGGPLPGPDRLFRPGQGLGALQAHARALGGSIAATSARDGICAALPAPTRTRHPGGRT
jgi:hypothetical protein